MGEIGPAVAFWILAIITVGSALAVVTLRNILHAALFLILSFVGVAGFYVTLRADFVAAVQILIYAGAISVLMLFAIMLTRDATHGNPSNRLNLPAFVLAGTILGTVVWIIAGLTRWDLPGAPSGELTNVNLIADAFFNRYILPFEVASVLLLAAMIGAIVLIKEG